MEQNSKVKIETYLVYLIFIIFFGVVGYKIHENNKAKDVVQSSRQEIKDIKDSTLNIADQFIEDVKKDKAEKDSTILVLTKEKKKINEKIIKISTENTKKDSEVNQYKEKAYKIYSDYQEKDAEANQLREKAAKFENDYNQKDSEVKDYQEKISNFKKDTVIVIVPIEKIDTPNTKKFNFWKREPKK